MNDLLAAVNDFLGSATVQLQPKQYYQGVLRSMRQETGVWVAEVCGDSIEVPQDIAEMLQPWIGKRVIIANLAGKIHAGRRTS